jgi:hypothetical protein
MDEIKPLSSMLSTQPNNPDIADVNSQMHSTHLFQTDDKFGGTSSKRESLLRTGQNLHSHRSENPIYSSTKGHVFSQGPTEASESDQLMKQIERLKLELEKVKIDAKD